MNMLVWDVGLLSLCLFRCSWLSKRIQANIVAVCLCFLDQTRKIHKKKYYYEIESNFKCSQLSFWSIITSIKIKFWTDKAVQVSKIEFI